MVKTKKSKKAKPKNTAAKPAKKPKVCEFC